MCRVTSRTPNRNGKKKKITHHLNITTWEITQKKRFVYLRTFRFRYYNAINIFFPSLFKKGRGSSVDYIPIPYLHVPMTLYLTQRRKKRFVRVSFAPKIIFFSFFLKNFYSLHKKKNRQYMRLISTRTENQIPESREKRD